MCRLFGFRSVIHSQVHQSLVRADNALMLQSSSHPDGWGVAWYLEGVPHVLRSLNRAIDCKLFKKEYNREMLPLLGGSKNDKENPPSYGTFCQYYCACNRLYWHLSFNYCK